MTVYLAGNDEETVAVKRIIKRIVIICFVSLALFIALFAGDIVRTMCTHEQTLFSYVLWDIAGLMPRYHAVMDIPVERGGKTVPCKLYRRSCSPFLLLGPYPFKPDALPGKPRSDFFFIEREHVRGRCWDDYLNDRAFFRKWLWIASDLDPGEIDSIVPNYYFDVKRGEDPATGLVHFTCSANSAVEEETFRFSIPKHLIDALPECRGKPQSRNEWALILLGLYVLLRISVFVFCLLAFAAGAVTA